MSLLTCLPACETALAPMTRRPCASLPCSTLLLRLLELILLIFRSTSTCGTGIRREVDEWLRKAQALCASSYYTMSLLLGLVVFMLIDTW